MNGIPREAYDLEGDVFPPPGRLDLSGPPLNDGGVTGPGRSLDERVRLVAADPDLAQWQRDVLDEVRSALRWAEVDRETSKSLARRVVALNGDHETVEDSAS